MLKRRGVCVWIAVFAAVAGLWSPDVRAGAAALTEAECVAFAKKVEAGLQQGNPDALNSVLDMRKLLERATSDFKGDVRFRQGFINGGAQSGGVMGNNIVAELKRGAQFRFMRIRKVGADTHALFRLSGEMGVNYHEMYLERGPKGIEIVDLFIYMSGEPFSETMRRMFLQAAQQQGVLSKLLGRRNEFIESIPKVQLMTQHVRGGQGAKALAIYNQLPAEVKKEKTCMLLRMQAAQQVGDQAYLAALGDLEKAYGSDPRMLLIRFDGLFMTKQFDKCLELLANLEKQTGPDAYIYTCNANVSFAKGSVEKAREWAAKAVATEPDFLQGYWSLISIHLATKSFAEVKGVLLKMERSGLVEFNDLTDVQDYAEFVKSPEYKAWMKERPKKDALSEIPGGGGGGGGVSVREMVEADLKAKRKQAGEKATPLAEPAKKDEPAKPAVPKGVKKIVVLKDGREIMATMVMEMGKQMAVKDITGKMHELAKDDVKEIRNP